ncbi:MAG: UbiA family prenyltransferase, partial [bacterium]
MTRSWSAFWWMLRPAQWTKNLLVLAPLVFARRVAQPESVWLALQAATAFCLVSSALYIVNDLLDRDADRRHPVKRRRSIASGTVHRDTALVAAVVLGALGFLVVLPLPAPAFLCLLGFAALGLAYSLQLKRVVIVDVLALAGGYVLRAAAGAFALQVEMSSWL